MGVPGFFAWILKNCGMDNIIKKKIENNKKIRLYIDCNCLIHPVCFQVLDHYKETNISYDNLINKMFKRIFKYIDYLIKYTNAEYTYIAIDGVAPMAKINQQRKRRYKSSYEKIEKDNIKIKYGKNINNIWNNTCITPGTEFMNKLDEQFKIYILNKNIKYSSYLEEGEGEHKILQILRNDKNVDEFINVIYGLDADLIFLALSSNIDNIFLLRENNVFNKTKKEEDYNTIEEDLIYVSIDNLKICLKDIFYSYDINIVGNYINDFIFLCFLLGNDFIPHIPRISIKNNGIDNIMLAYKDAINNIKESLINDNYEINMVILIELLKNLLEIIKTKEIRVFKKEIPMNITEDYEKEIWKFDNLINIPFKDKLIQKYYNENYKYNYYDEYFGGYSNICQVCKDYCTGLKWITDYYFKKCSSWTWQYKYTHGPYISDIINYLTKNDINKLKLKLNEPLKPLEQLLVVIPPSQKELLPLKMRYLMTSSESKIIDYFPIKFKIDYHGYSSFYECIPIISSIDYKRLKSCVKEIE